MKKINGMLLAICLSIMGCASSYKLVEPVFPEVGNPLFPTPIDSLQPVFTWKPLQEPNVTYDFILYEGIGNFEYSWEASTQTMGKEILYIEGLTESRCELKQPLKPKTEYYWSVRVRKGSTVSDWAQYDYTYFTGLGIGTLYHRYFVFRTPEERAK